MLTPKEPTFLVEHIQIMKTTEITFHEVVKHVKSVSGESNY